MLSLRSIVFTTISGISLWGLFSLLVAMREPGLLSADRNPILKGAIKGCETLNTAETRSVCPQLFCQRAVIEARLVSHKSRFAVTVDKYTGEGTRLIGGAVSDRDPDDPDARFLCLLSDDRVVAVKVMDLEEFNDLAAHPKKWVVPE